MKLGVVQAVSIVLRDLGLTRCALQEIQEQKIAYSISSTKVNGELPSRNSLLKSF